MRLLIRVPIAILVVCAAGSTLLSQSSIGREVAVPGSPAFFAPNERFITRTLWGTANEPPFFHHSLFTTLRQAILAHAGEALASRQAFQTLLPYEQDALVEFLKTLQVLPPGTQSLIVDENGRRKIWPPKS
ncbi:MAG: hypothetical protein V7647_3162 [Acidobacteriota bacterium]